MKVNVGCNALTMSELAKICGGMLCLAGGHNDRNIQFNNVCTDSRESEKGSLFVALGGERVDGHDYINVALDRGGECVLCERIPDNLNDRRYVALVVNDTLRAIGELAKAYDRRIHNKKVAITGSVGKTTTKEFVAAVLSEHLRLHKTEGNYNSTLGMPLSLLTMKNDTEVSVLEMGMSNFGEIEYLSRIAEPDIAVITNIGSSHMEYLGSRENICRAKLEIVKGLKKGGLLLLNGDEPMLRNRSELEGVNCLYVGRNEDCDVRATNILEGKTKTYFDVTYKGVTVEGLSIPIVGQHYVYAALFAYAIAVNMGFDEDVIERGLNNFRSIGMRQMIFDIGDITVFQDCYNASPESMKASIAVLHNAIRQRGYGRMTALLGDMYELGDYSKTAHESIGLEFARREGSALYTFGELANTIADGAILGGMQSENIFRNADLSRPEISGEMLINTLRAGDMLLVKASRGVKAERVIEYLKENEARLRYGN
ncbi:MAG: UDP-N-acetylmuramoyl-tripeptide--D-alanyl-D-alanine ligase [Ruminococcaceae bacterium]|nr:UDP-N-acetylmuramoyl-tripeptide--D-alanyl-D-alanine ligase [Oscillospiraceae bacterium]